MKKGQKRNDGILAAGILVLALALLLILTAAKRAGSRIEVRYRGRVYGVYSLNEEQTIQVGEGNVLQIVSGEARMLSADCKDQLCVHMAAVSKTGETITCLPNQVSVRVLSGKDAGYDAVTG